MPKFFVSPDKIYDEEILLLGQDALHVNGALRMRAGDKITICDGNLNDYECVISSSESSLVRARIVSHTISSSEPNYRIRLFQAIPKSDKFDFIVQKAVETGVNEIIPVMCARCVSKPDIKSLNKKTERWQRIAYESAMQCGRGIIPYISEAVTFKSAVVSAESDGASFICYEDERKMTLKDFLGMLRGKQRMINNTLSFFVGPEGGYDADEVSFASEHGVKPVSLGKRILRCETASVFVLSAISYDDEL